MGQVICYFDKRIFTFTSACGVLGPGARGRAAALSLGDAQHLSRIVPPLSGRVRISIMGYRTARGPSRQKRRTPAGPRPQTAGKRKCKTQSLKSETTTPQSPFSPPAAERSGERAVPFLGPADHVMRDIVKRHRGFSVGRFMIVEPLHGSSARRGAPTSQQQVPPSPRAQRAKSRPLRSRKKKIVPKEGLEPR